MWAGFVAGVAASLLLTLIFVVTKLDDHLDEWQWVSVFWPMYVLYAFLALSSMWSCFRYSSACRSEAATSRHQHTDVADDDDLTLSERERLAMRASIDEIDAARERLRDEVPSVVFSLVVLALIWAATILIGVHYDCVDSGLADEAPSFNVIGGLFVAALLIVILYSLVAFVAAAASGAKHAPEWTHPAAAFACCRPHEPVLASTCVHEVTPVCLGGYPTSRWYVTLFNVAQFLLLVAMVVATFLFVAFLNDAGSTASDFVDVAVPLWIGIGLVVVTGFILVGAELMTSANTAYAFDLTTLSIYLVALIFVTIFLANALHADTLSPQVLTWPLVVALSLIVVVFFFIQWCDCWRYNAITKQVTSSSTTTTTTVRPSVAVDNWASISTTIYDE